MSQKKINDPSESFRNKHIYGIIVKTGRFGEGHCLYTLLDRDEGLIRVTAFGAGKAKSKRRSSLLTGNLISGVAYRKNEDSGYSLNEVSTIQVYEKIKNSLKKQSYYFLITEVLSILFAPGQVFGRFSMLLSVLDKMSDKPRVEKYAFFFLFKILRDEGIFPAYSEDFISELGEVVPHSFKLGNGTHRFLNDVERVEELDFWDKREITRSVIENLKELLALTISAHFNKKLKSFSLMLPEVLD